MWVNAQDCTKDKITGLYSVTDKHIPSENKPNKTKIAHEKTKNKTKEERKRAKQQADWSTNWENSQEENNDKISVPSHYKEYTVANRRIVLKQPIREVPEEKISYDLPKQSKTISLAQLREEPKPI